MTQWIDAMFVRGGTSKGVMFDAAALPGGLALPDALDPLERVQRDRVLCAALGSPDPYGRQLDGMGGGLSSLSKAMIVAASKRPGVDLDYTFAQVDIGEARVDYSGNCGNLSSAVAPFALAAGLVRRPDGVQRFTLHNLNTAKTVVAEVRVVDGAAATVGDLAIPGVAGSGSPIHLVYPDPGGSRSAGLLPSGAPVEQLRVGDRAFTASIVDAAIPLVVVPAAEYGLTAAEQPDALDADAELGALLEQVRRRGAVRAGLCEDPESAPLAVPKIVLVGPAAESTLIDGTVLPAADADVLVRPFSMGQAHRAVPGTAAMCLAAAARIAGSVVADALGGGGAPAPEPGHTSEVRLATASGVVRASATSDEAGGIAETALARTARLLMRGQIAIQV